MNDKAHYIILEDAVLLSKKDYSNWREIQDEYHETFVTSFSPLTCDELIAYFEDDYKNEACWPFSMESIIAFFESGKMILRSE